MDKYQDIIDQTLQKLKKSPFRAKFSLSEKEIRYLKKNGMAVIRSHAEDFIQKRLAPAEIPNDGKQTPMRGHPVFIAQHATATCCRKCLYQWHKIKPGKALNEEEQKFVIALILEWIKQHSNQEN